jgi:hypothetical protein
MSIEYKYTIVSVNAEGRCMEVVYEADGHQTMHIGARLPFEGEPLEDVIKAFAPVQLWAELAASVLVPEVGITGVIAPEPDLEVTEITGTPSTGGIPVEVL